MRRAGIDVGGTKCLGVLLDHDGRVTERVRRPTSRRPDELIDSLVALAGDLGSFDALGVGVPGLVTRSGVLRAAPHLIDVAELDVARRLSDRLGCRVEVDNDATCAALAEWERGAARGVSDVVVVTLGTGIGGGVVADGRLLRGAHGFAGEFGHMVVHPDGPPCPCGRRGCWERFASGGALGDQARAVVEVGAGERILAIAGGDPASVRGEHARQAALEGDAAAITVIDSFSRWVALGLVNLANLLDPARIVLGGGLAASGELFLERIAAWFHELLYAPELRTHPDIVMATLGDEAGAIGAALLSDHR